jgi:hypothetical protein|tara:strand:+ start:799 stop:2484 length:1686 start_codon:yes stop_codon:yes gene_type:complete
MAEERSQVTTGSPVTGGQTAPAQSEITTALLTRNSLQLTNLSRSVANLSGQMNVLSGSLQSISRNLATSQSLERQKEAQEQALEARLAQQQLREGKESVIEKKIESAAIAPAQKLAAKAQFTLGRLGNFFLTLIGGWLVDKGLDTLNALSTGNKDRLEEIKNQTLLGLGAITALFIGAKLVIGKMIASFGLLGIGLAGFAVAGLFTRPGQELLSFLVQAGSDALKGIQDWWNTNFGGGNQKDDNVDPNSPDEEPPPGAGGQEPPPVESNEDPNTPPPEEIPGKNMGGVVEGPGGIDNVPTNLTAGEYVIRKPAVDAFGTGLMDSINTIDITGAQQALYDKFGLDKRVKEVGAEQALIEFRQFKMEEAMRTMAPYADVQRQITESGESITRSVSGMIQNGQVTSANTNVVNSGYAELPEDLIMSTADFTNDRANTGVDRSLDATLAREDMLLEIALDKEAKKAPEVSPSTTIQPSQPPTPPRINMTPMPRDNTVSEVISQSTDEQPVVIVQSAPEQQMAASAPQPSSVAAGGPVNDIPSISSNNRGNMYVLTTISLLNIVTS